MSFSKESNRRLCVRTYAYACVRTCVHTKIFIRMCVRTCVRMRTQTVFSVWAHFWPFGNPKKTLLFSRKNVVTSVQQLSVLFFERHFCPIRNPKSRILFFGEKKSHFVHQASVLFLERHFCLYFFNNCGSNPKATQKFAHKLTVFAVDLVEGEQVGLKTSSTLSCRRNVHFFLLPKKNVLTAFSTENYALGHSQVNLIALISQSIGCLWETCRLGLSLDAEGRVVWPRLSLGSWVVLCGNVLPFLYSFHWR